jgi:hypothetical protein
MVKYNTAQDKILPVGIHAKDRIMRGGIELKQIRSAAFFVILAKYPPEFYKFEIQNPQSKII